MPLPRVLACESSVDLLAVMLRKPRLFVPHDIKEKINQYGQVKNFNKSKREILVLHNSVIDYIQSSDEFRGEEVIPHREDAHPFSTAAKGHTNDASNNSRSSISAVEEEPSPPSRLSVSVWPFSRVHGMAWL